jgi:hypothetical protein
MGDSVDLASSNLAMQITKADWIGNLLFGDIDFGGDCG